MLTAGRAADGARVRRRRAQVKRTRHGGAPSVTGSGGVVGATRLSFSCGGLPRDRPREANRSPFRACDVLLRCVVCPRSRRRGDGQHRRRGSSRRRCVGVAAGAGTPRALLEGAPGREGLLSPGGEWVPGDVADGSAAAGDGYPVLGVCRKAGRRVDREHPGRRVEGGLGADFHGRDPGQADRGRGDTGDGFSEGGGRLALRRTFVAPAAGKLAVIIGAGPVVKDQVAVVIVLPALSRIPERVAV